MRYALAAGAFALVSACTVNYVHPDSYVTEISPVDDPDPLSEREAPRAIRPVVEVDQEASRPRYIGGNSIGGEVARSLHDSARFALEKADYEHIERAADEAIASSTTGNPVVWHNTASQRHGHVKVLKSLNKDGRFCREFEVDVRMGGGAVVMDSTACKNTRGDWYLLD